MDGKEQEGENIRCKKTICEKASQHAWVPTKLTNRTGELKTTHSIAGDVSQREAFMKTQHMPHFDPARQAQDTLAELQCVLQLRELLSCLDETPDDNAAVTTHQQANV